MKYRKPEVIELGARMQRADGQVWPDACISGAAASGTGESCGAGTSAGYTCATGSSGPSGDLCIGGSSPGSGSEDCFAGASAYYCETGSTGDTDPNGCRFGSAV